MNWISILVPLGTVFANPVTYVYSMGIKLGVYKHWTGLLEWWNSGMVDWIFLFGFLIIYDVSSL